MMKIRILPSLSLVAVLLAACTSSAALTEAEVTQQSLPVTLTALIEPTATQSPVAVVEPVATSRGPNLEATDPSTVSLASGQIQFVEFFRFT